MALTGSEANEGPFLPSLNKSTQCLIYVEERHGERVNKLEAGRTVTWPERTRMLMTKTVAGSQGRTKGQSVKRKPSIHLIPSNEISQSDGKYEN